MEFIKHKHPLTLNENFHGGDGDFCHLCNDPIRSPLVHSVYSCNNRDDNGVDCVKLLLHKSCAELPLTITDSFFHPQHSVVLNAQFSFQGETDDPCSMCSESSVSKMKVAYNCRSCQYLVCIKCITSPRVHHPSHQQHTLRLVQRSARFLCYGCNEEAFDSSSCRCLTCPFWIHNRCALLPCQFQARFHRHPLRLAYSLPLQHMKFGASCKICKTSMNPFHWLYYCANCRFFAHVRCATSTREINRKRSIDKFYSLPHLPAPDEVSVNSLRQMFIHSMIIPGSNDVPPSFSFSTSSSSSSSLCTTSAILDNEIDHWSHEHTLTIRNKCSTNLAVSGDDNKDDGDKLMIICDGCTKPMYSSTEISYVCQPCKYFLHRYCAELPKQLRQAQLRHRNVLKILSNIYYSHSLFICNGCKFPSSGMRMMSETEKLQLDISCAALPRNIKHEAHDHPLTLDLGKFYFTISVVCRACGEEIYRGEVILCCRDCEFLLHGKCALKPHQITHPWDRDHRLALVMNPEMIEDHPQDYNCEFCSEDINTNYWFYHCSFCDLSFHIKCIDLFYRYSQIKFGTSNIKIDQQLHQHSLTLVLMKRKGSCRRCGHQLYSPPLYAAPVLECRPCNFIICLSCVDPQFQYK